MVQVFGGIELFLYAAKKLFLNSTRARWVILPNEFQVNTGRSENVDQFKVIRMKSKTFSLYLTL